MRRPFTLFVVTTAALVLFAGCGSPTADDLLIGAECESGEDCLEDQECLTQFKGGYCGLVGCVDHGDCPRYSSCVEGDDGTNYCFRDCEDKAECNTNRSPDHEASCASNVDFTSDPGGLKACVPPSS